CAKASSSSIYWHFDIC
nr:immunoglobulin heavy chain junction region [Macaca mulatta]MOW32649.1 immunoglobulin heavy chain junction region [Macaca mulatta]